MKRIMVVCTCSRYWKRFAVCGASWVKAICESRQDADCEFRFSVAIPCSTAMATPCDAAHDVQPFETHMIPSNLCCNREHSVESKSLMIRYLITHNGAFDPTHYLFTDADIIVPNTIIDSLNDAPENAYLVADRIDLNDIETNAWISGNETIPQRVPNPKKRGMGWFQVLPRQTFLDMCASLPWGHPGYDLFDWKINDMAVKSGIEQHVVPGLFLHMRHGDDGANWKGTTGEW